MAGKKTPKLALVDTITEVSDKHAAAASWPTRRRAVESHHFRVLV